ncbi:MAG: hypothetical protein Kow0059_20860 [Candidatus Sumerlaeia bacterium]
MKPRVLLVDDEEAIRLGFSRYLGKAGYDVDTAGSLAEARERLGGARFDAALLDLNLPDGNGLDMVEELRGRQPDLAIVVITGSGDIPLAVEAMRRGADSFQTKPVNMRELDVFLQKSLELGSLRRREHARTRLAPRPGAVWFGATAAIRAIMEDAAVAARNDTAVLITGETGTGKGVLARFIHDQGPRAAAPFVEVNCSALGGDLLASELFGHVKGAFTSAVADKQGLLDVADGGTLFLDEIGDMPLAVQAQFLKVIEEKKYRRLGEVQQRRSEFRLICATNQNLELGVRRGTFREDLLFRINVFPLTLPPLRERAADLPEFIRRMLAELGAPDRTVTPEAMRLLQDYHWPGNLRELRNVLERALLLARGAPLGVAHFPGLRAGPAVAIPAGPPRSEPAASAGASGAAGPEARPMTSGASIGAESGAAAAPGAESSPAPDAPGRLGSSPPAEPSAPGTPEPSSFLLDDAIAAHIRRVMDYFQNDTQMAARALGISRASLYRKLQKIRKHDS